jgi:hypothetical protein
MPTGRMWDDAREVGRSLGPVDPTPPGFLPEGESVIAGMWRTIAGQGLTWVVFGGLVLVWPNLSLATLVALMAACALVHAALSGAAAVAVPIRRHGRVWLALDALAAIVVGSSCSRGPRSRRRRSTPCSQRGRSCSACCR